MEIGIDSFAANEAQDGTASALHSSNALAELLERMEYADKVGLDVFGIGEHYRKEFLDSAPAVILAAAAAPHQAHPPDQCRHRVERGRPGQGLPKLRDPGSDLSRSGGNGGRTGFIHGVLSAFWSESP